MTAQVKRRLALTALVAVVLAGACTLNPQPLPPGDERASTNDDGEDGGIGIVGADPTPADASVGDGGRSDAGDAGEDADAGP